MIIQLRDGYRLIKRNRERNFHLEGPNHKPIGIIRPDVVDEFLEVFNGQQE